MSIKRHGIFFHCFLYSHRRQFLHNSEAGLPVICVLLLRRGTVWWNSKEANCSFVFTTCLVFIFVYLFFSLVFSLLYRKCHLLCSLKTSAFLVSIVSDAILCWKKKSLISVQVSVLSSGNLLLFTISLHWWWDQKAMIFVFKGLLPMHLVSPSLIILTYEESYA